METEKSIDRVTGKETILYNYDFSKGSKLNTTQLNNEIKAKFNIMGISATESTGEVRVHSLEELNKAKEKELKEIIDTHIPKSVTETKTIEQRLTELEEKVIKIKGR